MRLFLEASDLVQASIGSDLPVNKSEYMTVEVVESKWKRLIPDLQKRAIGGVKDKFFRDKYKEGSTGYKRVEKEYHASREQFVAIRKGRRKITNYLKLRFVMSEMGQTQCCVCGQGPRDDLKYGMGDGIQIHHIHSLAYGGANLIENFCLLCKKCHDEVHSGYKDEDIGDVDET